jgi:hypothetical protein
MNSFAQHIPKIWNVNANSQFIVESYATTTYCISYMKIFDKKMTSTFKRIREEHEKLNIDIMKTIGRIGKDLVNMQQMFSQQVVHIIMPLPLNTDSRKCVFINISPKEQRAFILKKQKDLQHEPDDSEDIKCSSIIDYYICHSEAINGIYLSKFASNYIKKGRRRRNSDKSYIIRYVKCNKHKDL